MSKVKVEFKHSKKVTEEIFGECTTLLICLNRYNMIDKTHPSGRVLSEELGISAPHVRKLIQIIRENATLFLSKGSYLIANTKGYYLTKNKKEIRAFMKKTHLMGISKIKQFNEAEKMIGDADWETGI